MQVNVKLYGAGSISADGGYIEATIKDPTTLSEDSNLVLYVGEGGKWDSEDSSFNGGGKAAYAYWPNLGRNYYGYSGAGATDLRYQSSNYTLYQETLDDRILVAGGAGSGSHNPWKGHSSQSGDLFAALGTDGGTDITIDSEGNIITSNVISQVNGNSSNIGTAGDGTQSAGGAAYYGSIYNHIINGGNDGFFFYQNKF